MLHAAVAAHPELTSSLLHNKGATDSEHQHTKAFLKHAPWMTHQTNKGEKGTANRSAGQIAN